MCEYSSAPLDAYIEQLVQLYKNSVYAYALTLTRNTYDAEDITLEAYERTYLHLRNRPGVQIQQPKNWLFTAVKHIYLNSIRGRRRPSTESLESLKLFSLPEQETAPMEIVDTIGKQPDLVAEENEGLREVSEQIAALPEGIIRESVSLNILEGFTCPEISKQLNRPLGTIKASVHRGKAELRVRLISWKDEEK